MRKCLLGKHQNNLNYHRLGIFIANIEQILHKI